MKLKPKLKVIWRGDNKTDYILIKFDILHFPERQEVFEGTPGANSRVPTHYKPIDHQAAFEWWKSRAQNSLFPYVCPSCGTVVPLRNRIVVSKRRCPKCSEEISLTKIDAILDISESDRQQKIQSQSGCGCVILLVTAISSWCAAAIAILCVQY